jgi:hypothetical protein
LSFRSEAEESASVFALAVAFLVVIPEGDLLLLLSLPVLLFVIPQRSGRIWPLYLLLPLLFWLSSPKGICCCYCRCLFFYLSFRGEAEESACLQRPAIP